MSHVEHKPFYVDAIGCVPKKNKKFHRGFTTSERTYNSAKLKKNEGCLRAVTVWWSVYFGWFKPRLLSYSG